jgi:hypothetical protein
MLCLLSPVSASPASWKDGPELPSARWFHAGGATPNGHVFAFGGYVYTEAIHRAYGVGELSLDVLDSDAGKWRRGPPAPRYRSRYVKEYPRTSYPSRIKTWLTESGESEGTEDFPHETPSGAADHLGRIFWFSLWGAIFYDSRTGAWDQFPAPIHHFRQGTPSNSWYEGTRPKYDRQSAATAAGPDNRIYLVAGVGHLIPQKAGEQSEILSSVEVFDPGRNDWSEAPPLQRARQMSAAAFGPDGRLYVFGGCACIGSYDAGDAPEVRRKALIEQLEVRRSVKEVEVYDPATRTWSMRSPMPTPRQLLAAATGADGKIYVIGGSTSYAAPGTDVVEVYDPATDSWTQGPSLGIARKGHTASVTPDGRIWVVGGLGAGRSPLDPRGWLPGEATDGPLDSVEILETRAAP